MAEIYEEIKVYKSGSRPGMVINKPVNPIAGKKYPLIIAHHGILERGNGTDTGGTHANGDLENLRVNGSMSGIEAGIKKYGIILIEPQTSADWQYGETEGAYQYAKANLPIDLTRCYITGLSLGGGGTFRYLAYNPDAHTKFAAASPQCAGPLQYFVTNGETGYKNIAFTKMPIWAFHCADDKTVTPAQSTNLAYSKAKGYNPDVKFYKTIWNTGGHNGGWKTWSRYTDTVAATSPSEATQFNDPADNWYEWLLTCRIPDRYLLPRRVGEDPIVIDDTTTTSTTTTTTTTQAPPPPPPNETTTTTTKAPPVSMPIKYNLLAVTTSSDVNINRSLVVQATFVNPTNSADKKTVTYRAAPGDRVTGTYESLTYKSVTIDFAIAPSIVVGPTKEF